MLCGFSQAEIENCFPDQIEYFAKKLQLDNKTEFMKEFAYNYDGYNFSSFTSNPIYNPISVNGYFENPEGKFEYYWNATNSGRLIT